jgi:hypothetical protein
VQANQLLYQPGYSQVLNHSICTLPCGYIYIVLWGLIRSGWWSAGRKAHFFVLNNIPKFVQVFPARSRPTSFTRSSHSHFNFLPHSMDPDFGLTLILSFRSLDPKSLNCLMTSSSERDCVYHSCRLISWFRSLLGILGSKLAVVEWTWRSLVDIAQWFILNSGLSLSNWKGSHWLKKVSDWANPILCK